MARAPAPDAITREGRSRTAGLTAAVQAGTGRSSRIGAAVLAVLALVGFAGNSLLARLALGPPAVDAATYTAVRVASGAATLWVIAWCLGRRTSARGASPRIASVAPSSWAAPLALFAYAICFSLAYLRVEAGMGALVLFGAVQMTMIGWGVAHGERPGWPTWVGLTLALAGLAALGRPGVHAPDPAGAILMAAAGSAWGMYSLMGRAAHVTPLAATAANFMWSVPLALATVALAWSAVHATPTGLLLAVVSGALASGIGYSFWYAALPSMSATTAAVAQLSVPVLTAAAAVAVLGELLTPRVVLSGVVILCGVGLAMADRSRG